MCISKQFNTDQSSLYPYLAQTPTILQPAGKSPATGYLKDFWNYGVKQASRPVIHYSRYGLFDANTSLCAVFWFEYRGFIVYFSGDSAMEPVLGQTGHKHGPIDLALLGNGVYQPRKLIRLIHASPEEAVEIGEVVKAKSLLEMHLPQFKSPLEITFDQAH